MKEIQLDLAKIEHALIANIRPSFLSVEVFNQSKPHIHILISHPKFLFLSIYDRINQVYDIIGNIKDLSTELDIIVEAYNTEEMSDIIEEGLYDKKRNK